MAKFQNVTGNPIITPPCRLQFLGNKGDFSEPDVGGQYSDGKYKADLLFDKEETDFAGLKAAVETLSQQAFGCPCNELSLLPFKDGDEKTWQGYPGSIYIRAKSKNPVDVYGPTKDPATGQLPKLNAKKLYAGCVARACLIPFAYMSGKDPGITFLLQFIQFLEDAPRFGGISTLDARDIFDEYVPTKPNLAAAAQPQDIRADEPVEQPPIVTAKPRGRPPKEAAAALEVETEEAPSARAKRMAAEKRESGGDTQVDLPMGGNKKAGNAAAKSLMDMM